MNPVNGPGFGSFVGTFLVGAAAGATIALLTTPRSGSEMRAQLKDASRRMGKRLQRIPDVVQKAGSKAVTAGQEAFAQAKEDRGYTLDKDLPRFAK